MPFGAAGLVYAEYERVIELINKSHVNTCDDNKAQNYLVAGNSKNGRSISTFV
jgi:hypothetical protein